MSVQSALDFLRAIPDSRSLREALRDVTTGEQLAAVAVGAGFPVQPEEIARAFALECAFRQMSHLARANTPGPGEGNPAC